MGGTCKKATPVLKSELAVLKEAGLAPLEEVQIQGQHRQKPMDILPSDFP